VHRSRAEGGFTLVEVLVAVGIAALLVVGVSAATQSTVRTAERQKTEARQDERRARAIELLRQDWREKTKLLKPTVSPPQGTRAFLMVTVADSIDSPTTRSGEFVTYTASEKGLSRRGSRSEASLLSDPVVLEFWDGVAWRTEPQKKTLALKLTLTGPEESVVLR
jgi:prepilin-type N-terminal cleavage/methylation domain-containing protein